MRHKQVGSGMLKQTYVLTHGNEHFTFQQTDRKCDNCNIALVIGAFSPSGEAAVD